MVRPHLYPRRQSKFPSGWTNIDFLFWMISMILWKKVNKENLPGGLKRGPYEQKHQKVRKLQRPFSRGGPKRRNLTMTTSTVTARRKGNTKLREQVRIPFWWFSMSFMKKKSRTIIPTRGLKKGVSTLKTAKKHENYSGHFPGGL